MTIGVILVTVNSLGFSEITSSDKQFTKKLKKLKKALTSNSKFNKRMPKQECILMIWRDKIRKYKKKCLKLAN